MVSFWDRRAVTARTVWLASAVLLVAGSPPCPAQEGTAPCDRKALQQAREDYDKALRDYDAAAQSAAVADAGVSATYEDGTKAFDEVWGDVPQMGLTELTMHTLAKAGAEAAEKLAPALNALELADLLANLIHVAGDDFNRVQRVDGYALQGAAAHAAALVALASAQTALQRKKDLEAACSKRKDSSPGHGPLADATDPLFGGASGREARGDPDLGKLTDLEKRLYLVDERIHALLEASATALGEAGVAASTARGQLLALSLAPDARLTGAQLADFEKSLKLAFQEVATGVHTYDEVNVELGKVDRARRDVRRARAGQQSPH